MPFIWLIYCIRSAVMASRMQCMHLDIHNLSGTAHLFFFFNFRDMYLRKLFSGELLEILVLKFEYT